jgi:mRNA interferase RelE/StbE
MEALADAPRPQGCSKLTGRDAWRIRVGDYRIIYEIFDDRRVVIVVVVGHRKDAYR